MNISILKGFLEYLKYYKDGIIGTTKIATIFEVLRDKNIDKPTMVVHRGTT